MKVNYLVNIDNPNSHLVHVKMNIEDLTDKTIKVFIPSWSPGSYLMREYARNLRTIRVLGSKGEYIQFQQEDKGAWEIQNAEHRAITIEYSVYCHELTVRTSHIDESHAFLHGPSYLMGIVDKDFASTIEFRFPALWSKIHTGLNEISEKRDEFIFEAPNFDVLLDSPVEIGCHESDGFMHDGKEHHVIFYGDEYPHANKLKEDMKTIVETVAAHFSDIPYEKYLFMTHFKRNLFGGLEHLNSTALHYDGRILSDRKSYLYWLALVAHEYFHTWNVKRIRPIELGPFDYRNENYTKMHWLTEGLTSFMDELFVYRSGLCSLEEYLEMQVGNLTKYYAIPGKKFHSVEDASFNAWVKLYRPDENSLNSSISYYLKGGLVFSILHFEFIKQGKNISDLLTLLWDRYKENPKVGVTEDEVFAMIETLGGEKVKDQFVNLISTTEDIDFETYYKNIGLEFNWEEGPKIDFGAKFKNEGDRVIVSSVVLDKAFYKSGIHAGDEIIAVDGVRFLQDDIANIEKLFVTEKHYRFTVCRTGKLVDIEVLLEKGDRFLKEIKIVDKALAEKAFK